MRWKVAKRAHSMGKWMLRRWQKLRVSPHWRLAIVKRFPVVRSHHCISPTGVGRMVQKSPNVVYKQWVEQFRDFLLVGEVESPLEWNPNPLEMHGPNLDHMTNLLALEYTITSSSGHSGNVQQFRSINHMVIFTTRDTYTLGFDLEAETSFVLPKCGGHPWFHPCGRNLSCCIKRMLAVKATWASTLWTGLWTRRRNRGERRWGWSHSRSGRKWQYTHLSWDWHSLLTGRR